MECKTKKVGTNIRKTEGKPKSTTLANFVSSVLSHSLNRRVYGYVSCRPSTQIVRYANDFAYPLDVM